MPLNNKNGQENAERPWRQVLFYVLATLAVAYAFLAGLKTIAEFDLGWQLATGRWIVLHRQIPTTDILSYTAAGRPWVYPIGAELVFYGTYLLGGYSLLSWLAAIACAAVVALLLRRGSLASAALAILAVPMIASRTTPRAELFTIVLFAAMLSLLWQQHETGKAKLWVLPILMVVWVNFHPGFIAGLALLGAYVSVELIDLLWPERRRAAVERMQQAWPWLLASAAATVVNPWGWNVSKVVARQEAAMGAHSQLILEWAPMPLNWARIQSGVTLSPEDAFYTLFLLAVLAVGIALWRRQVGAAVLIIAAVIPPLRHTRFIALFAIVLVVVAGSELKAFFDEVQARFGNRLLRVLPIAVVLLFAGLVTARSASLVTNRFYISGTNLDSFGTGLSWWFPQKAAAFVERANLPGRIFSSAEDGGYLSFRLGPKYEDYLDSRAIPFGTELMMRDALLKTVGPESTDWQSEAVRYGINVILLPIGRFNALQFFPVIKQFCNSETWRPVYLDEVSVVFLRETPETHALIARLQINCSTAPVPAPPLSQHSSEAFNQWANAAAVLSALGRKAEAATAVDKGLAIFPDSAYLHFMRGHMLEEAGDFAGAEQDYILATHLEPDRVAPWSTLANYYQARGRWDEAMECWRNAADRSPWPWEALVSLGYANLQAHKPKQALAAFDEANASLPANSDLMIDNSLRANIAHGRSRAYFYLGNLPRATQYEEEAARLLPDPELWMQLASLYEQAGRFEDASRVRTEALRLGHQ